MAKNYKVRYSSGKRYYSFAEIDINDPDPRYAELWIIVSNNKTYLSLSLSVRPLFVDYITEFAGFPTKQDAKNCLAEYRKVDNIGDRWSSGNIEIKKFIDVFEPYYLINKLKSSVGNLLVWVNNESSYKDHPHAVPITDRKRAEEVFNTAKVKLIKELQTKLSDVSQSKLQEFNIPDGPRK